MSSSEGSLFIGGNWIPSAGDQWITAYNPHTEEESGRVAAASRADIDAAVGAARAAFDSGPWPRMSVDERAAVLRRAAAHLRAETDEIARIITSEMGSPIAQSLGV